MVPRRSPSVSIRACRAAARSSQRGREQPTHPWAQAGPCCIRGPQNGIPHPDDDDFAKMKVVFLYPWRSGEPVSRYFRSWLLPLEKISPFFLALLMATEERASLRGPLPVGVGARGPPAAWAPLPTASFLLMNMLFVLF